MAVEQYAYPPQSYIAQSDLSAKQFFLVKLSGPSGCDICAATTDPVLGVLVNKPGPTNVGAVARAGKLKVIAGAVVAADAPVMSDAFGRAITATGVNPVFGRALEAATAVGQIICVSVPG